MVLLVTGILKTCDDLEKKLLVFVGVKLTVSASTPRALGFKEQFREDVIDTLTHPGTALPLAFKVNRPATFESTEI